MDTLLNTYVFNYGEVYGRAMFVTLYRQIPNIISIDQLDDEKAYQYITTQLKDKIKQEIRNTRVHCFDKKEVKNQTVFILEDEMILELSDEFCEIFYTRSNDAVADLIKQDLVGKKKKQRKAPLEINLVTRDTKGLTLTDMEMKRSKLDIASHYEDNFKDVDQLIQKRLNKKQDKGIVLLHGTPGTGKTTYLR